MKNTSPIHILKCLEASPLCLESALLLFALFLVFMMRGVVLMLFSKNEIIFCPNKKIYSCLNLDLSKYDSLTFLFWKHTCGHNEDQAMD